MVGITAESIRYRPAASQPPSEDEMRVALQRILASPGFTATPRRRAFLSFVVEETLAGRGDALKGFTIATAVFGRDETFDAKADPVVRLEARRLRQDLDSYYVGPGAADPIWISIPKGGYLPCFEVRQIETDDEAASTETLAAMASGSPAITSDIPASAIRPRARALWLVAALLTLALLATIMAGVDYLRSSRVSSASNLRLPAMVVRPFKAMDGSDPAKILAGGIPYELVSKLMRFPDFRIFLSSTQHNAGDEADGDRVLPAAEVPA